MSLSQDTCEAPARQARCFGEDRWAELDRIHGVGSEPNEEQQALAKRFSVPSWVVQHKLIEYVLAARHFAKCGEWPDGIKPYRPTLKGLEIWQAKWIKFQHDSIKLAKWKRDTEQRRQNRIRQEPQRESRQRVHSFRLKPFSDTPDDWQAEESARRKACEEASKQGIPSFVVMYGFLPWVIAARHFAIHGSWPDGKQPERPHFTGLTIWQSKWIKLQNNPAKFKQWQKDADQRSRGKRACRAELQAVGIQIPKTKPLTLSELIAMRKTARAV